MIKFIYKKILALLFKRERCTFCFVFFFFLILNLQSKIIMGKSVILVTRVENLQKKTTKIHRQFMHQKDNISQKVYRFRVMH